MTAETKSTRDRILEATAELLRAAPSAGDVSIRDICDRAGVQPPSVYHHFGDKRGLLDAVVADGFERYAAAARALVPTDDPVAGLARGWHVHVEFGVTHPAFYALMFGAGKAGPESPAARELGTLLRTRLERIARAGRLAVPIEQALQIVQAAGIGTTLAVIERGLPADGALSTSLRDATLGAIIEDHARPTDPTGAQAARLAATLDATPDLPLTPAERAFLQELLERLANNQNRLTLEPTSQ
jgi:AcrR family transcriptional regulator